LSKAIVFEEYGPPSVLRLAGQEPVSPASSEVRVRVKAAGIQPFDCLIRSGAAQQWMPAQFPQGLGNEFAGVVDAVGEGVSDFAVGDDVIGWAVLRSHAEFVWVPRDAIARKPVSMPWSEAGVLSASGQTAATAISALGVGPADVVIVHAAAGGVGSMAVQLARAAGARVIGTARPENHDYVCSLGATPVAYGDGLLTGVRDAAPEGITAAIVAANSDEALRSSMELVADRGRIGVLAFNPLAQAFGLRRISTERTPDGLAALTRLYEAGQLKIHVQEEIEFREAARAHELVEAGHVRGKIALIP
jgi:enoyl reductase